jgi:ubiquinone/menaquinone biosynthesis C-methylase UbiE
MAIESSNEPELFQSFEHQGWQTVGEGYERHFSRLTSQAAPVILDAAAVSAGKHVLDVCTGPGILASAVVDRGAVVTGVDMSSTMLALARKNVPTAELQEADAQSLPFEDGSFDAVICGLGVLHVPEPAKAFAEMLRVLKDGGYAAISTWQAPNPTNGFGLLFGALKAHGDLGVPLPHGPDMFQFSDDEKMHSALAETGFRNVAIETVNATWSLDEPTEIVSALVEGTVRSRALLGAQSERQKDSIVGAIESAMERYVTQAGYRVPMPMIVGRGSK